MSDFAFSFRSKRRWPHRRYRRSGAAAQRIAFAARSFRYAARAASCTGADDPGVARCRRHADTVRATLNRCFARPRCVVKTLAVAALRFWGDFTRRRNLGCRPGFYYKTSSGHPTGFTRVRFGVRPDSVVYRLYRMKRTVRSACRLMCSSSAAVQRAARPRAYRIDMCFVDEGTLAPIVGADVFWCDDGRCDLRRQVAARAARRQWRVSCLWWVRAKHIVPRRALPRPLLLQQRPPRNSARKRSCRISSRRHQPRRVIVYTGWRPASTWPRGWCGGGTRHAVVDARADAAAQLRCRRIAGRRRTRVLQPCRNRREPAGVAQIALACDTLCRRWMEPRLQLALEAGGGSVRRGDSGFVPAPTPLLDGITVVSAAGTALPTVADAGASGHNVFVDLAYDDDSRHRHCSSGRFRCTRTRQTLYDRWDGARSARRATSMRC